MEGTSIPIITGVCLALGKALKASPLDSRWIPLLCLVAGAAIGVLGYFFVPELHSGNIFTALFMGVSGGTAATGVHQIGKQQIENSGG